MKEMTSAERVMRVLRREEPDRTPHFEWLIDKKVREAICPDCTSHNDFAIKMNHDAILVGPTFSKEQISETQTRSEWGFVTQATTEEHGIEVGATIQTLDDFDAYTPPDPHKPGRYSAIEAAVKEWKGIKAIGVHLNDVFSIPRYLMSMEGLLLNTMMCPELVKAMVNMSVEINLEMVKEVAKIGADFIWTGDDYASNPGPLVSPDMFRDIFYEPLCRVMGGFKDAGFPIIKHTDGKLWPIIDMIIDSGIDCLDPIDPQAGMDMAEVKAKYGDRVALKGNVDCAQTLTFGTVEETIEETKEALRKGGEGGGLILSSSNSIHSAVKPENYLAMMKANEEFGTYPLNL